LPHFHWKIDNIYSYTSCSNDTPAGGHLWHLVSLPQQGASGYRTILVCQAELLSVHSAIPTSCKIPPTFFENRILVAEIFVTVSYYLVLHHDCDASRTSIKYTLQRYCLSIILESFIRNQRLQEPVH